MGIPGLFTQLRKYGTHTHVAQAQDQGHGRTTAAVIDGPSLAHSLYQLRNHDISKCGIIGQYNYYAVGKAAVAWLDSLALYGFEVEGIYFDGTLPQYKRQTRLDRMQGYVNKLNNYRSAHTQVTKSPPADLDFRTDERLTRNLDNARAGLPPPPFLVFAVVEALSESQYADRTWLVNGEADAYCASAAEEASARPQHAPSIIFTNDSDLVLFNFRTSVRITMINDMRTTSSPKGDTLELFELIPSKITNQGKPVNLLACAFYVKENQATLSESFTRSNLQDFATPAYQAFTATYDVDHWAHKLHQLRQRRLSGSRRPLMDSRISEPIHQALLHGTSPVSGTVVNGTSYLDLFLPVLLEDTARASAWRVGSSFREVAELLILRSYPSVASLLEHKRSGIRLAPVQVTKSTADNLNIGLVVLADKLSSVDYRELPLVSAWGKWRLFVMTLTLFELTCQNATGSSIDDMIEVLAGGPLQTWDAVHLSAQFQAQYYSMRILQQTLRWWENDVTRQREEISVPKKLRDSLDGLPGIADFFKSKQESRSIWREVLEKQLESDGLPVIQSKDRSRKKRRKVGHQGVVEGKATIEVASLAGNPYALLNECED